MASEARYQRLDSDEGRLPDGMQRTGYDADEQRYYYRDAEGEEWEGEPGNRYGLLHRVGERPAREGVPQHILQAQDREAWGYMLPFFLLLALYIIGVVYFIVWRSRAHEQPPGSDLPAHCASMHHIVSGDTCYDLARKWAMEVEDIVKANKGLDCDKLTVGSKICRPNIIQPQPLQ